MVLALVLYRPKGRGEKKHDDKDGKGNSKNEEKNDPKK